MKKNQFYILSIFLFFACGSSDDYTPTPTKEHLEGNISIKDSVTAVLNVKASSSCEWIITWENSAIQSVSQTTGRGSATNGTNVTIKLEENPSYKSERSISIQLANLTGTILCPMVITQPKSNEYIKLSPSSVPTFSNQGGSLDVDVKSNTSWTVSPSKDWVKCSVERNGNSGRVTITVSQYSESDIREAEIYFQGENANVKIRIKQEGVANSNISGKPGSDDNITPN